ncbi:PTS fructose transporter subunit IIC [Actinokineospora iranica]|uniref:PTS system D-fructose-specific IIB component (F1P-forming), Frc family /PTS system D-fructose-specific IIC component (F1P-forming), Frc family n=1 Tax=Actinokineospora iranica TaxID=1271860 RepID=A0A1G6UUS3_9PSEU|nr:fructose-specific PTS transporter subunit EIIC [Actinokineospora iranica]SDD44466.1 PTS system D-fructose-specific IIB component (F1P-forming), Frc family /PTS system D-fructose-specific IIC component (F1P-forming), Frc family [Actinokineospora iranica]
MKLVAVTSCPTGIAHTYMAAEALEQAAEAAGHELLVETQGSAGMDPLSPQDIAAARAVIFAADVEVRDRDRFAGKPLVQAGVKQAINNPAELIAQAVDRADTDAAPAPVLVSKVDESAGVGTRLRQWLMTGVSYMIPFVAAGGLLIALAFLFGGAEVASKVNGGTFGGVTYAGVTDLSQLLATAGVPGVLFKIGAVAFSMLVPILAGFIAFGIADRPGLVPGVVGGLLATATGAGFLGGLLAGLLAGGVAYALTRVSLPRALQAVMPVVIIPLVSTAVVGVIMLLVIGSPVAAVQTGLTNWLTGMTGAGAVGLGLLLGAMMAFDMGGPVNKVAYTFAVGTLASGTPSAAMAAVMAAGMVPPLGLALATALRRRLFTDAERKAGEAGWLLGASFITEGAIPFAAADPLRVIPSIMLGSAATGGLTMAVGATSLAPHGGIWVVGLIGKPLLVLLAIAVGMVIAAVSVLAAKSIGRTENPTDPVPTTATPAAA